MRVSLKTFTLLLCASATSFAWPGFTWDRWVEITGVERPTVTSPQSGEPTLVPLLQLDSDDTQSIASVKAWEQKRDKIKAALQEFLGQPTAIVQDPVGAEETGREDLGRYERIHLRIAGEKDDPIPAYYLKPKSFKDTPSRVMIVLHQTQAPGKQESCGMTGDPNMAFAKELVERGMPCIVPDVIGFGERIPPDTQPYHDALGFYERHPQWSFFGKMNWDLARVIDYIETLPELDATRIGVIGHSHGAYGSIMVSAFEPRIQLTVASCGFNTLRTDPNPNRWSHLTALLPRVGFYVEDIKEIPFDWHEIISCIAPKPYFNWATLEDDIFPNTDNLTRIYREMSGVYALYGKKDNFRGNLAPGKHRFPPNAREAAYTFIEKNL